MLRAIPEHPVNDELAKLRREACEIPAEPRDPKAKEGGLLGAACYVLHDYFAKRQQF